MSNLYTSNKKNGSKIILSLIIIATITFFAVNAVSAINQVVDTTSADSTGETKYKTGNYQVSDLVNLAIVVANIIWGISGSLALLAFIYGGVIFIISSGSSERVNKAKAIITGAVVGLVIVFTSYTIVFFIVHNIFGIDNPGLSGSVMKSDWFSSKK